MARRSAAKTASTVGAYILDDIFTVKVVDPDGKRFDLVSRIEASNENGDIDMLLDVNTSIYAIGAGDKLTAVLTNTLSLSGDISDLSAEEAWRPSAGPTLADKFEYVVYGKVFKMEGISSSRVALYVSFGGLLMKLDADPTRFASVSMGSNLYLLIRKV